MIYLDDVMYSLIQKGSFNDINNIINSINTLDDELLQLISLYKVQYSFYCDKSQCVLEIDKVLHFGDLDITNKMFEFLFCNCAIELLKDYVEHMPAELGSMIQYFINDNIIDHIVGFTDVNNENSIKVSKRNAYLTEREHV